MKGWLLASALLLLTPAMAAAADWQFKPFFGAAFAGDTSLIDLESAAGNVHPVVGVSSLFIGETLGVEADFGVAPGFFSAGKALVAQSNVTMLTGNLVIAVPQHLVQYTLRPYFVGGGGLLHASSELYSDPLPVASNLPAMDIGGGVTGFVSRQVGVNWDVRYFRSLGGGDADKGTSVGGPERLSFWRATIAVVIRR